MLIRPMALQAGITGQSRDGRSCPPLSWPTTATSSSSSRSTTRRTVSMCCSIVRFVSASNRLDPAEGKSMTWQVTWSTRWGSSSRNVAPLTGQPWTNSTSGPDADDDGRRLRRLADVEPTIRVAAEQFGCVGGGQCGHGVSWSGGTGDGRCAFVVITANASHSDHYNQGQWGTNTPRRRFSTGRWRRPSTTG